jgi:glycosyltransferase involved in cell wall biosynthesis
MSSSQLMQASHLPVDSSQPPEDSQVTKVPLISVITPTWRRYSLLGRCAAAVESQDYPKIEHIIVSDGQDEEFMRRFGDPVVRGGYSRYAFQLPEHDESMHWGHLARLHGTEMAAGELITYCDDDDLLRPHHCRVMAAALAANPDAGWAYSQMASHHVNETISVIGQGAPACGNIGTPMIMHRREILEHGTWGPASAFEDWELVLRWINEGIKYVEVGEVTSDVWPSAFHGH